MSKPPDPPKRKTVTLPESMWQDIASIQAAERIVTEAEALRRVVNIGIREMLKDEKGARDVN